MTTLKLRTPVRKGTTELTELTFRRPLGKDVRQCGFPTKTEVTASGTQIQHVDTEAAARLISALAVIPPTSVDEMDPADFTEAVAIIAGFFNPQATSSPDAGNSPASTEQAQTLST
jgi:Phage tail assembly chaperone proteins, E, or 41 or 14